METKHELKDVKLISIVVSKTNPRKHFDQESITELAASVKEKGVIQPIVLRPKGKQYELVCGERRYRASVIVKDADPTRDSIPAIIRELNDEEVLQLQIIENLQRKDVHPMDEAVAFKALMAVKGFDVAEIAKRIGKGPGYVAQRLKLNDLIDEFQKAFYQNRLNLTETLKLCRLSTSDQKEIWDEEEYGDNTQEIELNNWMLKKYQRNLTDAPFDIKDPSLNETMGACSGCAFNSASNVLLFPDAVNAICTNSKCYHGKADISFNKLFEEAKNDSTIVLVSTEYDMGKVARELISKGITVLKKYTNYEVAAEKPEHPDREDLKGNFDTIEEEEQAWQEELRDYEDELQRYEAKIESGKLTKAFVVEGDNRGKYIYVTLKKGASTAEASSSAVKNKEKDGTITAEDIKAEIQRIKDREKRALELDEEKKQPLLYNVAQKSGLFKHTGPLALTEKRGLLVLLAEFGSYSIKGDLYKAIGCKNSEDYNQAKFYQHVAQADEKDIDQWIAIATRILFSHKLSPVNGVSPETNGKAAVLVELTTLYDKKGAEKIEADIMEARGKRELKVENRIAALNKQLKELTPKKSETKAPAKTSKKAAK